MSNDYGSKIDSTDDSKFLVEVDFFLYRLLADLRASRAITRFPRQIYLCLSLTRRHDTTP